MHFLHEERKLTQIIFRPLMSWVTEAILRGFTFDFCPPALHFQVGFRIWRVLIFLSKMFVVKMREQSYFSKHTIFFLKKCPFEMKGKYLSLLKFVCRQARHLPVSTDSGGLIEEETF